MKKIFLILLILAVSETFISSCNTRNNKDDSSTSKEKVNDSTSVSNVNDTSHLFSTNVAHLKNGKEYIIQDNSLLPYSISVNHVLDNTIIDTLITFPRTNKPDTTCHFSDLADKCVKKYQGHENSVVRTDYVSFGRQSLASWINRTKGADTIEFKFGTYTNDFVDAVNHLHKHKRKDDQNGYFPDLDIKDTGRITIFLYAYNFDKQKKEIPFLETSKNKSLPAYNLGNLHP